MVIPVRQTGVRQRPADRLRGRPQTRTFTHVRCRRGRLRLIDTPEAIGEVVNVGGWRIIFSILLSALRARLGVAHRSSHPLQ
jgi:hypothetical protein